MGIYKKLPSGLDKVDVIIAGGGTAGCVVAGRLAQADPSLIILVIEGGPDNYNRDDVVHPLLFLEHLVNPERKTHEVYPTNTSVHVGGRAPLVTTSSILGGGSSINASMYSRPQRSDLDSWNSPGWSAEELLPYLRKLETYHGPGPQTTHGDSGPVHVSDGTFINRAVEDDILSAGAACGYPEQVDQQDLESSNGFQRWQSWISPDGRRQDTAHTYLHPLLRDSAHPNLHVLVETDVLRVLFSVSEGRGEKRASGVEFVPSAKWHTPDAGSTATVQSVRARKLVVISAGAYGSPLLLERSGIGAPEVLQRAGVETVVDLPGVGENLQDHTTVVLHYKTTLEPGQTADEISSGRLPRDKAIDNGDKRLGWNMIDVAGKIRPSDDEISGIGPEFKTLWNRDFKELQDRPLALMFFSSGIFGDARLPPPGQYCTVAFLLLYPQARGRIHITGPSIGDPPSHDVPLFGDAGDVDLQALMWGYKRMREIMRRTALYGGESAWSHPIFPPGSAASLSEGPLNGPVTADLVYTAEDDKALEGFLRDKVTTSWHQLGSAQMALREDGGVVDSSLDVYGVRGLKVVDLSIAPENVGGNTAGTALLIGEKGAQLAADELGLQLA